MSKCDDCRFSHCLGHSCLLFGNAYDPLQYDIDKCAQFVPKICNTEEQPAETKEDPVNSPSHYQHGGIETIDIIRSMLTPEEFRGYLKGNIMKYRERAPYKGNTEQDYAKARKYYEWLKEVGE